MDGATFTVVGLLLLGVLAGGLIGCVLRAQYEPVRRAYDPSDEAGA